MRYRLMATYRGTRYEAGVGPTDADVVLFTSSPPAEETGFEPGVGHWRKRVSREDVDELWECRPVGQYRSQPCLVLEEIGDRLHITHLGHDAYQAERLGYWQVDRGVYEVVVPHDEVSGLTEERVEYPVHRGGGAYSAGPDFASRAPPQGAPEAAPAPLASLWSGQEPAADHESSPNGTSAADVAGSLNGVADPLADALAPPVPDELSGLAWTDAPDKLPPPRPLPKRRRAAARPSGFNLPEAASGAAGAPPAPTPAPPAPPAPAPPAPPPPAPPPPAPAPSIPSASEETAAIAEPTPPPAHDRHDRREQHGVAISGRRRRARVETRWVFRDLVDMAAIPHGAYAVDEEVDGALCLIKTDDGYEVFSAIDGGKHEVRFFDDEEAAYFYLFGVLAAEAVRGGKLVPKSD